MVGLTFAQIQNMTFGMSGWRAVQKSKYKSRTVQAGWETVTGIVHVNIKIFQKNS